MSNSCFSQSIGTEDSLVIKVHLDPEDHKAMSPSIDSILAGKYPAKKHFKNVLQHIKKKSSAAAAAEGVVFLEGQKSRMNEDNDQEVPFRQRRYFYYLTGCELADCYVTYDLKTHKSTLFIPPINPDDVVWSGLPLSAKEAMEK